MKKIEDLLEDFMKDFNISGKEMDIKAIEIFLEIQKEDVDLMKAHMVGIHKGVLTLEMKDSMQSFQIMMKKTPIIQKINTRLGQSFLRDIRINIQA